MSGTPTGAQVRSLTRKLREERVKVAKLRKALIAANEHLIYVGWGDGWERSVADEEKLPQLVTDALRDTA